MILIEFISLLVLVALEEMLDGTSFVKIGRIAMYSNTTYLLAVFVFGCSIIQAKVCDVTDYGARGDSFTNSTSAIQKAIDDCCSGMSSQIDSQF